MVRKIKLDVQISWGELANVRLKKIGSVAFRWSVVRCRLGLKFTEAFLLGLRDCPANVGPDIRDHNCPRLLWPTLVQKS